LTADEALVHHIILLNRLPSAYAELRSLPREAAQQYFRQYLQLPDKIQEMQAEAAKSIFTADVHELRYQDLEQAIECLDLLAFGQGKPTGKPR
jgi:phage-related protein